MRVLAFHLPQFHPIPENDAWWGKGFTEWTNVTRARPLFDGHYQPRLPADLGFYDLRLPEVLQAQADLARQYGIHGFCYHYYWFKGGKRLLERPLEQMLASGTPDFPFCLCWANENWTRRWDGLDQEVLMSQQHDEESDIAFLHSVLPYFRDPRYIRVGNRPLLVVYRGALIPDLPATVARWHAEAKRLGESPPYLVAAESLDMTPAAASAAGFDATCEFPPHGAASCAVRKDAWPAFHQPFSGLVLDYEQVAAQFLGRAAESLRRFRTVTLNWDNTARKKSAAHMMQGFSLPAYHRWLSGAVATSRASDPEDEQFVFINAWNEWAEGTYLEPDHLYGHAYLEATRAAISGQPYQTRPAATSAAGDSPSAAVAVPDPDATPAPTNQSAARRKGRLSVVGIAMIGNEADFVEAFVRENCQLLDHLLIADHNSLDGTREILAELVREGLPISVERIDDAAYAQAGVTNRLLDRALTRFNPDWILPIDADEILDVADRATLEAELDKLGGQHGRMAWVTHVPAAGDDRDQAHPIKRLMHRYAYPAPDPEENPFAWKLAVNAALIGPYRDRYALEKGNHRIVFRGTQQPAGQPVQSVTRVRLRHYPVRSYEQLAGKIGIGVPQKHFNTSGLERAGIHWSPMWQALMAGRSDLALLQGACRQYLDPGRKDAQQAADLPLIADALPIREELRLEHLRVPVPGMFIRWIGAQLKGISGDSADERPSTQVSASVSPSAGTMAWRTHLGQQVFSKGYHDRPRTELIEFIPGLPRTMLDIGCAGGATSMLLRQRHPDCHTVGIEINPEAAALAAQRLHKVICADVETLDLKSAGLVPGSFDLMLVADVLEHLNNPWRLLVRLRPLLQPQGRIVACLPNIFNIGVLDALARGSWRYDKDGILDVTHLRFFARDDVVRLFTETGYAVEHIHALPTPASELPDYRLEGLDRLRTQHLQLHDLPPARLQDALTKQFVIVAGPGVN